MSSIPIPVQHSRSRFLLITIVAALGLGAAWFIATSAWRYTNYSFSTYTDYYWPRRGGLIPHIAGGFIAITTGLAQLWLGSTNRTGALHRALGKVYAAGVLVGSAGAFYMALTIPAKDVVYATGLFGLATAWVLITGMALVSIYRRNIQQHREWMLRSYTVTFAFVTFRLIDQWLIKWHVAPDAAVDAIMAWACWSIPLLFVEPLIQMRKLRRA
ncbi:MAG: DUF2306 domain-containing protein [Steroidobacteraceae bacterium]